VMIYGTEMAIIQDHERLDIHSLLYTARCDSSPVVKPQYNMKIPNQPPSPIPTSSSATSLVQKSSYAVQTRQASLVPAKISTGTRSRNAAGSYSILISNLTRTHGPYALSSAPQNLQTPALLHSQFEEGGAGVTCSAEITRLRKRRAGKAGGLWERESGSASPPHGNGATQSPRSGVGTE
jgi:hypothetical protein